MDVAWPGLSRCGHCQAGTGPAGPQAAGRPLWPALLIGTGLRDGWEKGRDLPFTEHHALRILEFSGWKVLEFLGLLPFPTSYHLFSTP